MKPAVFVRIASVLVFIHAVLHTIGGVFGKVEAGPATVAATAMKANHFVAFGNPRTFWDFYTGLGLGVTIFLTMESVVLWLLAPLTEHLGPKLRSPLAAFAIGYLFFAVDSFRYFFIGPVVVEILIAGCLFAAIAVTREVTGRVRRAKQPHVDGFATLCYRVISWAEWRSSTHPSTARLSWVELASLGIQGRHM